MLDYLTILRMHYSQNLNFREIGASVGCGKTAVGRFITRFEESEFTYPFLQNYSNELNRLSRKLRWFAKPNILLVDEVGYEPLNAEETHVFFQLINVRYETGSMIMTSNKTF